jgi:hypothetical protein
MMHQFRLTKCNKCASPDGIIHLCGGIDNEGAYAWGGGQEFVCKISAFFSSLL